MGLTKSFVSYIKDDYIRSISSSGGVFYAIAKQVLFENGVVFGASFDNDWQVCHVSIDKIEDLPKLMQSKYVQSSINNTFIEVKSNLVSGRLTLFCGTPCQIEGLILYLENVFHSFEWKDKLYTIDFICHGVPSRLVWRRYLDEISNNKTIRHINFRDKTNGWSNYSLRIDFSDNSSYICSQNHDLYIKGFVSNLYLRESCHNCKFRGVDRVSDFTIADFWGAKSLMPDVFDDNGISVIMTHSNKSRLFLEGIKKDLYLFEIDNESIVRTNSSLVESGSKNKNRNLFFKNIGKSSVKKAISRNLHKSIITKIINRISRLTH